ncbi:non-ribosomal peptide synthetase [Streptomyces sp. NBC_00425]|uniref:non-ribosomal peptide synthetase n=1 Tax=Streptomyces sp. NBC_00425 TaxID=2975740 RepID=UPI002E22640F
MTTSLPGHAHPEPSTVTYPMSYEQESIWLTDAVGDSTGLYVESWVHRIRGDFSAAAAQQALTGIVRRHESLRSRLHIHGNRARQEVLPPMPVPLTRCRVSPADLQAAIREVVSRPLPLDEPPLLRACLLEVGEGDAVLAVAVHHAVVDGWALHLLDEEFSDLYGAALTERAPERPEPPLQFGPWALRQRTSAGLREVVDAYWKPTLADAPSESTFPLDHPRPEVLSHRGGLVEFALDADLTRRLRGLGRRFKATPFVVYAAAVTALLARHGQQDVVLGTPVSRRDGPELEPMIACLTDVMPLRQTVEPARSFGELVLHTKETVRSVTAHKDVPYTMLVQQTGAPRSRSRPPLFQVVLTVDDAPAPGLSLPGAQAERLYPHDGTAKFDVFFHLIPARDGWLGRLEYAEDLFSPETARQLVERLRLLLLDAADDPARAVGDLAVTTAADRSLLDTWADGPSPRGTPSPAHLAVARSARSAPDLTAVVHGRDHLTYAQLEAESDALAAHLLTVAHPGDRVGVLLERTVRLPIAVLAVLKAGCCCVPLDPAYPAERITFMLRDSRCGAVLTSSRLQHHITRLPDVPPLLLDEHRPTAPGLRPGLPDVHPEDPAYLLYTSGSTGRPKGVVMPHRSLANLVQWQSLRSARGATTAQFAPLSFDVAFQELFSTWAARGTLVLVDNEVRRDPARLLALIRTAAVERLFLPYVALQQIAEYAAADDWHGPSLREVICAGEQLFVTPAIRDFFTHRTSASLENQYGPTETHVVTAERLSGDPSAWPDRPSIGRPVPGARIRVLDDRLRLLPPGAVGEICIGGESVATGYLARPDASRQRFVQDPHDPGAGRLYRSGDLGRFRPDGTIAFAGRRDGQVKIRGHRVECGEVEAAVKSVPGVTDAVVTVDATVVHDKRLIAHYIPAGSAAPDARELRRTLRSRLPEHLVPSVCLAVPAFPLTPSGKVDRAALRPPAPRDRRSAAEDATRGLDATERRVAALWSELLGADRIGPDDDFFALGGNSVLAVRLLLRIREEWGVQLTLGSVFAAPTVARLAGVLADGAPPVTPDPLPDAGLDPTITPTATVVRVTREPEHLLLTGATGFLGAFLLRQLLTATPATVHCLVRASGTGSGTKRIRAALEHYQLWDDAFTERVVAVPGDLAQPQLGLSQDTFTRLSRHVDAVYHAGASVNLTQSYRQLENANVRGTAEVLRLAASSRSVPLHHISTVGVYAGDLAGRTHIRPEDPLPPAATLWNGYAQSKWAAEMLLVEARRRGLPVSIYRPTRIAGDTARGLCQPSDYLWLLLKGCVEAELAPADPETDFDLVPVDVVSKGVVELSLMPEAASGTFHLAGGRNLKLATAVDWLCGIGYRITETSLTAWRDTLAQDETNAAFPLLSLISPEESLGMRDAAPSFDAEGTWDVLSKRGITLPEMSREYFAAQVHAFVKDGFLPPPH